MGRVRWILGVAALSAFASSPCIAGEWAKTYGDSGDDSAYSVEEIVDLSGNPLGYIVAGESGGNTWVLRIGNTGTVLWEKTYGQGLAFSIQKSSDGFLAVGITSGKGSATALDNAGALVWQKTYDSLPSWGHWDLRSITPERVALGRMASAIPCTWECQLPALLFLGVDGTVAQQRVYRGGDAAGIVVHPVVDNWGNSEGFVILLHRGFTNAVTTVVRTNDGGDVQFDKAIPDGIALSIQQTSDSGFILAGFADTGAGGDDVWVVKLDSDLLVSWRKAYGGGGEDRAESIQEAAEGGYVLAGTTSSFGAGGRDAWLLKLGASGDIHWQKTYGGVADDSARAVHQTKDGGFIVAGETRSIGAGGTDCLLLKLDANGQIPGCWLMVDSDAVVTDMDPVEEEVEVTVDTFPCTANHTAIIPAETLAEKIDVCSGSSPHISGVHPRRQEPTVPGIPAVMNWLNNALGYTCPTCIQTVRYGRVRVIGDNFGEERSSGDQVRIGDPRLVAPLGFRYDTDGDVYSVENIDGGVSLRIGFWSNEMVGVYLYPEPGEILRSLYGPDWGIGLHWLDTWLGMWLVKNNEVAPVASNVAPIKILTPLPE
jgi:hypothetical protein